MYTEPLDWEDFSRFDGAAFERMGEAIGQMESGQHSDLPLPCPRCGRRELILQTPDGARCEGCNFVRLDVSL
jgi:hypothetical protein